MEKGDEKYIMVIENFNSNWLFYNDIHNDGEHIVQLPHDAMLTEKRLPGMKNGAAAGFFPGGRYVYKKKLFGNPEYKDKAIYLEFEGIYMKSSVYLNDVLVGGWNYGYTGFYVNLTDKLRIGEDNEIKVIADNSQTPNSRWYTGSGIYRDVNLIVGHKKHLPFHGIRVITESIEPAVLRIKTEMEDLTGCGISIQVCELDQSGNEHFVAEGTGADCRIEIQDAKLWNAEHPDLYSVYVRLSENGRVLDEQRIVTGIRTLKWSAEKGFQINGKSVKLRGGCIHHDNGILGACAYKKVEFRKAKILKEAGFNAIRSAHNPISKSMLEACDKIGLYVMDEAFDQWKMKKTDYDYGLYFEEDWEKDLSAMVLKDRNHPSVIMYSIGNEIADTGNSDGVKYSRLLSECCHKYDNTRPTISGINPVVSVMGGAMNRSNSSREDVVDPYKEAENAQATASLLANMIATAAPFISRWMGKPKKVEKLLKPCLDAVDIAGYNYADNCYMPHHKWNPDRIMIGTETYPQSVAERWQMIQENDFIIGDFMWTAMDYLGEAGIGVPIYGQSKGGFNRPYPCISGGCGVIDLLGHMETEGYHAAIAWGQYKKPYIAVRPVNHSGEDFFFGTWRGTDAVSSWSWKGMDGRKAEIEVYSPGTYVELFQDGVSLGKKELRYCKVKYEAVYTPGSLEAIAYDNMGKRIGNQILKTAGDQTIFNVIPEETTLKADGQDMTFVSVELTDDEKIVKMLEDKKVTVCVKGEAELLGIGSGQPVTEEKFTGNSYTTYLGRMGFYVRNTGKPGKAEIEIKAENIPTYTLQLEFE